MITTKEDKKLHDIKDSYPKYIVQLLPDEIKDHYAHYENLYMKKVTKEVLRIYNISKEQHCFYDILQRDNVLYFMKIVFGTCPAYCLEEQKVYELLSKNPHPNILLPIHYLAEPKCNSRISVYPYFKFDLYEKVVDAKYSESDIKVIFKTLLNIVDHIHKYNIIIGDLKLENILVDDTDLTKVYLTDFESCIQLQNESNIYYCDNHYRSTPTYLPPEFHFERALSLKTDIWMLGCILYILLLKACPVDEKTINKWLRYKPEGNNKNFINMKLLSVLQADLLSQMFNMDYKKRPSAKEILDHNWLKK